MSKKDIRFELINIGIALVNMVFAFSTSVVQTNRIIKEIRRTRH